ncbi:competence protein ComK [uncultured Traorella sp.]|uniref:competence protein ComK n=1 Tax=uncultured Traorella sp. TaxID=1929048 RepID=UPI0025F75109|nr:competence protein ComK [uncultured Traorella sp.]
MSMTHIFMIMGNENGCEIIYTQNHEVKIMKSKCRVNKMVYQMAHAYYRPVLPTLKLIKKIHGYSQKVPVLIEYDRLLLFPTISMKDPSCCWINYYCVADIKGNKEKTTIFFGEYSIVQKKYTQCWSCVLPIDKRVIRKQLQRCHEIHSQFRKDRIIELVEKEIHSKINV